MTREVSLGDGGLGRLLSLPGGQVVRLEAGKGPQGAGGVRRLVLAHLLERLRVQTCTVASPRALLRSPAFPCGMPHLFLCDVPECNLKLHVLVFEAQH